MLLKIIWGMRVAERGLSRKKGGVFEKFTAAIEVDRVSGESESGRGVREWETRGIFRELFVMIG